MGKNNSHKKKSKKDKKRSIFISKKGKNKKAKYSSDEESESQISYSSSSISKSREKTKKKRAKKVKKKSDTSSLTSSLSDEISTSKNKEIEKVSLDKNEAKDIINDNTVNNIEEETKDDKKEEEAKCTAIALRDEDNNNLEQRLVDVRSNFIKLNYQDLPNFHKKLIIYNLPPRVNDDEIKNYVLTLLTTLNLVQRETNPIISFQKMEEGLYYIFEFILKDDIDILINLDQTDWRGYRIRIQKPKRFFTDYNDTEGGNVRKRENKKNVNYMLDSDNKLYMGGIPVTAKDDEVRRVVEAFGQIKTFNLVKDSNDDNLNRGFCFFEYLDEKVTERAIRGLNNLEMGDRRLRVQKASFGSNTGTIAAQQKAAGNNQESVKNTGKSNFSDFVPTINPMDQIDVPLYASLPSRVIQIINVICPEDVMDDLEYREIVEDIRNECLQFGTVLNVEIPRPDKSISIAGPAVGKVFLKFATLQAAKKARYRLSGRKYNRRTMVASFYPEHYFDVREFNFQER